MNLANIVLALNNIKAHPKTTIVGALIAVATTLTSTHDWKHALLAVAIMLLSALAKDPLK
jgi:hypothetical protein